jgi:hypothetical protein
VGTNSKDSDVGILVLLCFWTLSIIWYSERFRNGLFPLIDEKVVRQLFIWIQDLGYLFLTISAE